MASDQSKTPEPQSPKPPAASTLPRGLDPLLRWMLERGMAVDRQSYLEEAFCSDGVPDPLPAELEQQIPWQIRRLPPGKQLRLSDMLSQREADEFTEAMGFATSPTPSSPQS